MSRGMPSMVALLGLLAVAGYQNRNRIAEMLGGRNQDRHGPSPGRAAVERPVRCRHHRRRERVQHLARPGCHALAGGRDPGLLGPILLHPGPDRGHGLVRRVPAAVPGGR